MKKIIYLSILCSLAFLWAVPSAYAQEDEIGKFIDKIKKFNDKYVGKPAELAVTNGFTQSIIVKVSLNATRDIQEKSEATIRPGKTTTFHTTAVSDHQNKIVATFSVYRDKEGEEYFLFSFQREFYLSTENSVQGYTANEKTTREYAGIGRTAVLFVNNLKNTVTVSGFNDGGNFNKPIDPGESIIVLFNNDKAPFANILIDEWGENENGEPVSVRNNKKRINFNDVLFDPFIIDEAAMR